MKSTISLGVCLAMLSLSLTPRAQARTLHVSLSGGGEACTEERACGVSTALQVARRGDVLAFSEGDFPPFDTQHAGVLFLGAPGHKSRIVSRDRRGHFIGVKHDDTIIRGLVLDGDRRSGQHGLIRIGTSRGVKIQQNHIIKTSNAAINAGGSWKRSEISDLEISGNTLCHSGFPGKYGELVYVGDHRGTSTVNGVRIYGNTFCQFTDNAIDIKPKVQDVRIFHNWIYDQVLRGSHGNHGTIVAQSPVEIYENAIENVIGGSAVFNLPERGVKVSNNVIQRVQKTTAFVRSRTGGEGIRTGILNNVICDSVTDIEKAFVGNNNAGIDAPRQDCTPLIDANKAKVEQYQTESLEIPETGEPPPPVLDVDLAIDRITFGEHGPNVVRVYFVQGEDDLQMEQREFKEGSVKFFHTFTQTTPIDPDAPVSPSGQIVVRDRPQPTETQITIRKHKRKGVEKNHHPGWVFYLDKPYPTDAPIWMIAEKGWVTGAPAIDQAIPIWSEDEPTSPTQLVDAPLIPGQVASCEKEFVKSALGGAPPIHIAICPEN